MTQNTIKIKKVLSIYIAAFFLLLGIFNLFLNDILHQKVHLTGAKIIQQVQQLNLSPSTDKEVIAALAEDHGFMLEPKLESPYFKGLTAEKSEVFTYKDVSLKLFHYPSWLVESHLFILLNVLLVGVACWGYQWWKRLFTTTKGKSTHGNADYSSSKSTSVTTAKALTTNNHTSTLYGIQHNYNHCFALLYLGLSFPENVDLDCHFKVVISKGFRKLERTSVKLLASGGLAITLENIPLSDIENYIKRLHQVIFQAARVYRADLSRKEIKVGVCNYRADADQAVVYQLAKSALAMAKQNMWQHTHRLAFSYTQKNMLANANENLAGYIEKKKFMLFFQPLFDLANGEILQHEALIRVRHKSLGMLSAKQFISHLNTDEDVLKLDQGVLEQVIKLLQAEPTTLPVSINLHSLNWFSDQFWHWFNEHISTFKHAHKLQFEIAEEDFFNHIEQLAGAFSSIRNISSHIVIDNIKTSSGIALLRTFNEVSGLKLSFELIHGIDNQLKQQKAVQQIVQQASALSLPVYGVGVETQQELNTLNKLGVLAAQGFYFSEPLHEFTHASSY